MLVLSRHPNERLVIGDDIVTTIVSVTGDKVRIGIDAPKDVSVHRQEVYDKLNPPTPPTNNDHLDLQ